MVTISKFDAYRMAKRAGVSFKKDYHQQSVGSTMADLAKKAGYRKPATASGSRARYFFYHLQRLSQKRGWK